MKLGWLVALAALLQPLAGTAVAQETVEIGAPIALPELKDIRYLTRAWKDLGDHEYRVLYFFGNTCPLAQRYTGVMVELEQAYASKGVQFVAVNVSPADTIMDMAQYALDYGVTFPVLKDTRGDAARALGVTRTPEVAVLDKEGKLRYRGRVNDQFRLGGVRPKATREDLKSALDELLSGKPVSVPLTKSEGCSLTFPSVPKPDEPVTYAEHIAPLLNKHCYSCHNPDGIGPFSLDNYEKTARRAEMLAEVISEGRMPPWYAHPEYGEFTNSRAMTYAEKLLVEQWVQGGKLEGDTAKLPPLPEVRAASEWSFEPDLVIEAKMPNALPATGFIPYRYVLLPHAFEQDTYLEAIEIKSSNPKVMHHANLFFTPPGFAFNRSQHFVTGTVPGGLPSIVPEGYAIMIPKGATLGLQIHYVTTGKAESDLPSVALRYCRNPVKKRTYYNILDNSGFDVPPFHPAYEVRSEATLDDDVTLLALFGHMHLRGKDMAFIAHYPSGESEPLLSMPNYNFDWQLTYYVEPGSKTLPKGTRVECVSHFDNSAFNPYNPAPDKNVKYGEQTVDEMCQGFIFYVKNSETLDLRIDPATGWIVDQQP